jgi:hypothetical protein
MTRAKMLRIFLLPLAVGAVWAGAVPSFAGAALVIENNFTGTGPLKITLEKGAEDHFVTCTGSTISGTTYSPPTANAQINSWSVTGCTASSEGKSLGPATVTIPIPQTAQAESVSKVKLTAFTMKVSYQVGGSTCKPLINMNFPEYTYTSGSSTNQMSLVYGVEFHDEFFPPPGCLSGLAIVESGFSFPDPQFEVKEKIPAAPTVATGLASGVTQTSGTLNGSITPNGLTTEYHFEYGPTKEYGTKIPMPDASLTSNLYSAQGVSKAVTGLLSGTTYHFRLVAKNSKGAISGLDQTFTTPAPACDSLSGSRIKIGDMNGDGKADIFRFTDPADKVGEAQVWRSEGKSFTLLGQVSTGFGIALEDRLADWDGDGDDDVFQFAGLGRVDGWRSNTTSYTQLSQVGSGFPHPCETRIGDISGDGKDDILRFTDEGNGYGWISNGTPNNYTYKGLISTGFGHSNEVKVGDINGDGYDDLFQFTNEGNGYLWRNNAGMSFTYLGKFASGFGGPNEVRIGDRNGDGRDDLFRFSEEGNGYYWQSNGDGSFTYMGNFTSGFGPSRQVRIADVNGDSKADILWFRIENGNGYAWLGDGKGGFESLGQIGTGFGAP